jgi:hypothetical protein
MSKSIRLSEKHGVNPSLSICIYCGESDSVILFGAMRGDAEAPRQCIMSYEPCDKCKQVMKEKDGIAIFALSSDEKNIHGAAIIKADAFKRMFDVEIPPKRVCRTDIEVMDMILEGRN